MSARRAVAPVLVVALVVAAVLGFLALLRGGDDGPTVVLELRDARGLVERADVVESGAVAGTVERIRLTDAGTARVTLRLHDGIEPPRADASAMVRPADLLGDIVLELSPGTDRAPLRGPIPVARTANQPRVEQVLEAFAPPVRAGLQSLLTAAGEGLSGTGEDLARAVVAVRPAFDATNAVLRELGSQDAALARTVADAERTTRTLAAGRDDVARTLTALDRRTGEVAARTDRLGDGLRAMPGTLTRLRATSTRLGATSRRLAPLADDLTALSPRVVTAAGRLVPFLRDVRGTSGLLRPTLAAVRSTLSGGTPALRRATGGLDGLRAIAPQLDAFGAAVQEAAPAISKGFFVNFADQAAEPGTQPLDPFTDRARNYWRGAAVFSCEAFGEPIAPGCLGRVLAARPTTKTDRAAERSVTGGGAGAAAAPTSATTTSDVARTLDALLGAP